MNPAFAAQRNLDIVIDGQPYAAVVMPADATPPLRDAVADLVRVIEKMSTAKLHVVTNPDEPWTATRILLGESLARYLSTEVAGGFTGTYLAMYATGSGRPASVPAFFDWFEYRATD
jgi:alpha-N-arabinofuranosidase